MGEIRSSWDIAREKADKLGGLSLEEQKKQREDRCFPIGRSLAQKYLTGYDIQRFKAEIRKYENEDKELIRQIALHQLVEWIDLKNGAILDGIGQGILDLAVSKEVVKTVDRLRELLREYQEAEKVERQKIDSAGMKILHRRRISGTAIKMINSRAVEEWQKRMNEVNHSFDEVLNGIKEQLRE